MAKFIYRMQNILDIKIKFESQARMQLASAMAKLAEEEKALESIKERKRNYEEEGIHLRLNSLHVREIIDNKNAIARMDEYIKTQLIQVRIAEKNLENARIKLQEIMKECKTYEKLREIAYDEFVLEQKRLESKEIDELTSFTYGQKEEE
ncbi:MAG TPA: flagellar export protein FliJ [Lachnospiraceae bacterium]|nr:flagellar export protein FliJ [Lachnospiraceae bacterium]